MKQILALVGRIDVAAQVQLPLRDVIGIVQLQLQEMGCRLFQRIGMIVRLDQVSGEFRIEPRLGEVQSERREDVRLLLVPVHDYPVGVPVKEPLQRGTDAGDHAGFQHGDLPPTSSISTLHPGFPGLDEPSAYSAQVDAMTSAQCARLRG